MKMIPLLLLAATSMPFAANLKPYVLANAGITLPKTKIDNLDDDVDQEDPMGYSATVGAGVRSQITPQLDFDGSVGFSLVSGGLKLENESQFERYYYNSTTSTSGYYDVNRKSTVEVTLYPKLIDLSAGVIFHATPTLALGGALVYSIPMGGTYEFKESSEETSECPSGATSCEESSSDSESDDGDIDDVLDEDDAKVNSFASIKLQGEYLVNDRLTATVAWMMPLGDYIKEDGANVSWSRLTVGVNYAFSLGSSSAN